MPFCSVDVHHLKIKIDFQDGNWGDHLGFPIGKILAIYDLQVTSMLPTKLVVFDLQVTLVLSYKFRVSWPLGS